jgi:autotransporter strand-loop-strand O-heptosyltransferase
MKKQDNVLIYFNSDCLGDSIAWMPYVEEYRKITNSKVYCVNFFNKIFNYGNINFINKEDIENFVFDKVYFMGFWIENLKFKEMNLKDPRTLNLQEVACDILDLQYKEKKPNLFIKNTQNKYKNKYVCIATQSTSQAKYWNHENGWEKVIDYLKNKGYDVLCIDKYNKYGNLVYMNTIPKNAIDKTGNIDIQDRINDILNCEFFIGLPSGLSWLAWALNKKVILISGFSDPKTEFFTPYRVINKNVCNSCWNDTKFIFPYDDFIYCPRHKNTSRIFECTKSITPEIVIEEINKIMDKV